MSHSNKLVYITIATLMVFMMRLKYCLYNFNKNNLKYTYPNISMSMKIRRDNMEL